MSQQANNPTPTSDAGQQAQKMPYGGRDPGKMKPMDVKPQDIQDGMKALFLSPRMGIGTTTWDPQTGVRREQMRREARGMSAQERMKTLADAGVTDRAGMTEVFSRLYSSPERAFMRVRGR